MTSTSLTPRALYEEVAELLRERIFSRELPPGSWIDELKLADSSFPNLAIGVLDIVGRPCVVITTTGKMLDDFDDEEEAPKPAAGAPVAGAAPKPAAAEPTKPAAAPTKAAPAAPQAQKPAAPAPAASAPAAPAPAPTAPTPAAPAPK